MGEIIKSTGNEAVKRWHEKMPRFFKFMMKVFVCIGTSVIGIHIGFSKLGIVADEWWTEIEPLILGISIGGAIVCKFTVDGGFRDKAMEKFTSKNTILDKDDN